MAGIRLKDHQIEAVKKMKNGCVLCGDVGSGKSRAAIAYYYVLNGGEPDTDEYVPMNDPPLDLYIITTARKRDTKEWEGELSPFLLSTNEEVNLYSNKVVVDSWNNIKKYDDVTNAFFIFDEQRVVGSGAWVKSFLKIAKSNGWILASATPGDCWLDYIPVFIANGFYKNRTEFKREHVVYKNTKYPQVDRYLNTGKLTRLRNQILVNMNFKRNTVSHHEDVFVEYNVGAYKEASKLRWNRFDNKPIKNASGLCYVWRRIANSDESRLEATLKILNKRGKAIIFYNFDYELELLKAMLERENFDVAQWNGYEHQPIPKSERWAYLVQYSAGAEGWNCVATDTIIFYSQSYSYKMTKQAAGRIDRMNTPYSDLYYYHLKSRCGIDLAISKALKNKKNFNESAFVNLTRGK